MLKSLRFHLCFCQTELKSCEIIQNYSKYNNFLVALSDKFLQTLAQFFCWYFHRFYNVFKCLQIAVVRAYVVRKCTVLLTTVHIRGRPFNTIMSIIIPPWILQLSSTQDCSYQRETILPLRLITIVLASPTIVHYRFDLQLFISERDKCCVRSPQISSTYDCSYPRETNIV